MSSTTSPQTFSDLYTDVVNRTRGSGSAASIVVAKRYINQALLDSHLGSAEKLGWAERASNIITRATYSTGTVSIAQGSLALTGTGTLWTTNDAFGIANARAGGKIVIAGSIDVYEVQTVGGAGSITLATQFVGEDVTDTTYIYFEDEFNLATDFLRPVNFRQFTAGGEIELISRSEFRRRYPRNNVPGNPTVATINERGFSGSTTPIRRVQFHRPPATVQNIPYPYITKYLAVSSAGVAQEVLSADADEPIMPRRSRHALVEYALHIWFRDLKDDTRSAKALSQYNIIMGRTIGDSEIGENRPQFRPRMSPYISKAKRPWAGSTGRRYDVNGRFDRME